MITPDEYNTQYLEELNQLQHTNIKCPMCGEEMVYSSNMVYTTNPPLRDISCPKCNHTTTIYC